MEIQEKIALLLKNVQQKGINNSNAETLFIGMLDVMASLYEHDQEILRRACPPRLGPTSMRNFENNQVFKPMLKLIQDNSFWEKLQELED